MKSRLRFTIILFLIFTIQIFVMPTQLTGLTTLYGTKLNDQLFFNIDGILRIPVGDDGMPVLPISYKGTTYLPVRAVGYLLNLGIGYDSPTKTVLITSTTTKTAPQALATTKTNKLYDISGAVFNDLIKFSLDGKNVIPVDSNGVSVLPISYNGTTYLPVRAIGNMLGLDVDYDGIAKTVFIDHQIVAQKAWRLVDSYLVWPSSWISGSLTNITQESFLASNSKGVQSTEVKSSSDGQFRIYNEFFVNSVLHSRTDYQYSWTKPQEILQPDEMIEISVTLTPMLDDGGDAHVSANIDASSFNKFSVSGEWNNSTWVKANNIPVLLKCMAPYATYDNANGDIGQKFEINLNLHSGRGSFCWIYIYEYK